MIKTVTSNYWLKDFDLKNKSDKNILIGQCCVLHG